MDKIVPAFELTLFDPTLSDACIDISEMGIDTLLDEGIFKSIPVVNILIGTAKTAQNIHDRNLLRQTIKFINTFNSGTIDRKKIEKYRRELKSNPHRIEEELGRVIILLNSNMDLKKSDLLAEFYKAYVDESINWEKFCELSDVVQRLFISDIELLYKIFHNEINDTAHCSGYKADRLISLGLLSSAVQSMVIGAGKRGNTERYIQVNELGDLFCKLSLL